MADGNVDTSIYRNQPNPLQTIAQIGPVLDVLGQIEVGKATQQAINPQTGEINRNALAGLLKNTVAGSAKATQAMDALEKLRSAGFAADQAGLDTFQKRMGITHRLFTNLASVPNPTMKDVHDIAAAALDPGLNASKYGITLPVVMNTLKQFRGLSSEQIKQRALLLATQARESQEALAPHAPGGQWVNQGGQWTWVPTGTAVSPNLGVAVPNTLPPTYEVRTPQGTRPIGPQPPIPGGGAVDRFGRPVAGAGPAGVGMPQPVPSGPQSMAPGEGEAAVITAQNSAQMGNELTKTAEGVPTRRGMLTNLENDLSKFTAGPGADWTRVAKAWINRNVPLPQGWEFNPKSIASQEEFNKQAAMLAQAQFAAIGGTGTDAKFDSAFKTSPNETLSQLGNKGIIRLLKGNEDAIEAKARAWQSWTKTHGSQTYPQFQEFFNDHFDPRVFQLKYRTPKERAEYFQSLEPDEQAAFARNLAFATKQGWVRFEQPKRAK